MSVGIVPQAAYDRISDTLVRALTGLSVEQLRAQPAGPESNPISWLAWHLSRGHDANFSAMLGKEQAWAAERWHERFRLPPEARGGPGTPLDEVRAFDPIDADALIGYWLAARSRSRELLDKLQEADLKRQTPGRTPPETFKQTIARMTSDTFQHVGQICYVRGLVDRHGWYGA